MKKWLDNLIEELKDIKPTQYRAAPPKKMLLKNIFNLSYIGDKITDFIRYALLTVQPYEKEPQKPTDFTLDSPAGLIDEKQIDLCQNIFDDMRSRGDKLEQKAGLMLATVAIIIPLIISLAYYVLTSTTPTFIWLTVFSLSSVLLLLSFLASFKALGIKKYEAMNVEAIIDQDKNEIKKYDPNVYGRGLLWCATMHRALDDHKAELIRASQTFAAIALLLFCVSAVPFVLRLSPNNNVQQVKGEVTIKSVEIEKALRQIDEKVLLLDNRLREIGNNITAFKDQGKKVTKGTRERP